MADIKYCGNYVAVGGVKYYDFESVPLDGLSNEQIEAIKDFFK